MFKFYKTACFCRECPECWKLHFRASIVDFKFFLLAFSGDHIFPSGDWKKVKLPVGACLKKLISDPVYLASSLNYEMRWCGNNLYFANCFSTPLIQGDHGNHHVNLKQEKVTSSVKVQCIISLLCLVIKQCRVMVNKITPTFNILKSTVTSSTDTVHT